MSSLYFACSELNIQEEQIKFDWLVLAGRFGLPGVNKGQIKIFPLL